MPHLLLALASMVVESPSIRGQSHECSKQAALSIAQCTTISSTCINKQTAAYLSDTDVVVLAVMVATTLPAGKKVGITFKAGKHL